MRVLLLFAATLLFESLCGADVRLQVLDQSRAPFQNVLVIVKYLEDGGETGRYLSDAAGRIPTLQLKSGLYRFILMCPYGICRTTIFELLDTQASGELALEVPIESTDEQGVLVGTPQAQLTILLPDRKPFAKELVLIRNTDSSRERWYKTDEVGKVDVELPSDPAIAVIVHRNKVFRYSLSQHCSAPNPSSYVDLECHVLARGSIVLGLP